MSALRDLLATFRAAAKTNREAGTYFEELVVQYLRHEPAYRDLYRSVEPYADFAKRNGLDATDTGIDLVAETVDHDYHAIQCKMYEVDHRIHKSDIDSFFTASGKEPFRHRVIVTTTSDWTEHAEDALANQQIPVSKIDLFALENSIIDWARFKPNAEQPKLRGQKKPYPHQLQALKQVLSGFKEHDRGKLLMACGTGKTFTSLRIAEEQAGPGDRVLFLVPSLALLSQTLTEWTQEATVPIHNFAVCSDTDVGKKREKDDDTVQTFVHELQYPATTDARRLAEEMERRHDKKHLSVVYATYQSIDVLSQAQKKHKLPEFDLIICDEAHRTTGARFEGQDESHFVKVHDNSFLKARKRLYMTATPRIYGNTAKAVAERDNVALCSMDDEALYGPELYIITFSQAVKLGLLVDYKVVVLSVSASHVSRRIQDLLKDENNQLRVDDAAKIVGCWKALSKKDFKENLASDTEPMRRAVAFCQVIEPSKNAKSHKVSSKNIAAIFQQVVEAYQASGDAEPESGLKCEAEHVDGTMNATQKEEKIAWLKQGGEAETCRILSNVRCLSEGVDVPALDAVLFLTPRSSQIDVVQSVGRVMRNAKGKTRGYIVLPVVIPEGMKPHEALNDNKVYAVVWQVLQALRSHDDRFDAMVNKLSLTGADHTKMEVIAITDKLGRKKTGPAPVGKGVHELGDYATKPAAEQQTELEFEIGEVERAIYAKLVEKVGNRRHWEDWAKDIAKIANTHIDRIKGILENKKYVAERAAFEKFAHELRDDLNDSINDEEIIEMLAQHMVTKPVFDALFAGNSFALQNPMSKAMQAVLEVLQPHRLDKEAAELEAFYASVKLRAEGIDSAEGRQKIIVELYDKFFRNAFPKMSERLGIVYTPVEIVDFILKSVDHLLRTEFNQNLGSEGVHILDPFTGTGTFITRLIQSGLIDKKALARKFKNEIHANEIVLLAYYIAAINIESAYHGVVGGEYTPFEGICLTDTFQLYEKDDLVSELLVDNSARRNRQKKLDIRVIVANPPYSIGQDSQNDNNQNVTYPTLDARIRDTYAARSKASLSRGLYDSYIRAIRWASDRIGRSGVVGFVTNASFVDANSFDGLRKCLWEEFNSLYILHLRGNQRTAGELSKREGGKVFGSGSRAPVAISLLVKNEDSRSRGQIYFRDIGDFLDREQKLGLLSKFRDAAGVANEGGWTQVTPDEHGDWIHKRDASFGRYLAMGNKKTDSVALFETYSLGVNTGRDAWAYDFSRRGLKEKMSSMIEFFNSEVRRLQVARRKASKVDIDSFVESDRGKIAWTVNLKTELARESTLRFEGDRIVPALYRPFSKQFLYFDRKLNERVLLMPRLFTGRHANRAIGVPGNDSRSSYSALMSDVVPSLHAADMVGAQYFPLYVFDEETGERRCAITDAGISHFSDFYPDEIISKEDVFYYVYGILHSADYRERYSDNLGKELPRIPRVSKAEGFWAFSKAGRRLGDLHVGFEQVPEYSKALVELPTKPNFRVEKMRFGKGATAKEKDKTVIQYNDSITVRGIPLEAYEYVVNGKSAIEWVMERQSVNTDKDSGIVKDANDYAKETMKDARYPLSLLLRVITVSLETVAIVKSLPRIDDEALRREDEEFNRRRLREIGRRFHQQEIAPLTAEEITRVPAKVEETPDGFVITMINGAGDTVEFVHLNPKEQVTRRVPA